MRDDLLNRTGRALYGNAWQSTLARDLGVSSRQMRRWAIGEQVPDDLPDRLRPVVVARLQTVLQLARDLGPT